MNPQCKTYQSQLIDILYDESELTASIQEHLDHCPECDLYWSKLIDTKKQLDQPPLDVEIAYSKIRQATAQGEAIINKRKNRKELGLFVAIAISIFAFIGWLFTQGYQKEIILFQLTSTFVLPIIVPFIAKHRYQKGCDLND
ncbi:hypothetical protein RH915_07215 [Serpentinicella sp. ANB-PHB4]|uniref:hypothetical protein n=1 Tax=Serpentinicella sp. ANB-PHB4 TaxID=3074076 RepID=UPI00285EE0F0|nr:hypothetical protein [Serpentinicella sp. ANB-PHB4]MDR5659275.1 hypothetical protein [Serpentinicella sp. ANB-PHB4]